MKIIHLIKLCKVTVPMHSPYAYQEVKDEEKIKQYAQKYLDFLKSKAKE